MSSLRMAAESRSDSTSPHRSSSSLGIPSFIEVKSRCRSPVNDDRDFAENMVPPFAVEGVEDGRCSAQVSPLSHDLMSTCVHTPRRVLQALVTRGCNSCMPPAILPLTTTTFITLGPLMYRVRGNEFQICRISGSMRCRKGEKMR